MRVDMKTPYSFPRRCAGWIVACVAVAGSVFPCGSARAQAAQPNYVAIVTSNVNVGGVSFKKGYQYRAISYDKVNGMVSVSDESKVFKIPFSSVRVVPRDQAGITIVRAEYGSAGQRAKNVTALLQRKLDGQQKASFVVSGADFGVRSQPLQQMPQGAGMAPASGGGTAPQMTMGGAPTGTAATTVSPPAILTIELFYKGTPQTVSASEGQPISIPSQ